MSGVKYSQIQWEREQQARQQALGQIMLLQSIIGQLQSQIESKMAATPQGLKDSFPQEFQSILKWMEIEMPHWSPEMDSIYLNNTVSQLEECCQKGREMLNLLIDVTEARREAMSRELLGKVVELQANLEAIRLLMEKWLPDSHLEVSGQIQQLLLLIDTGELARAEAEWRKLYEVFVRHQKTVTSLEAQDQDRRYVLIALRKVCQEMGWGEVREPVLQNPQQPGSPIIYEVNTYSAGKIVFCLSLEGLQADSHIPLANKACYREFDNLSEKLKKFGLATKFERLTPPDDDPNQIRKGELDLPDEGMELSLKV